MFTPVAGFLEPLFSAIAARVGVIVGISEWALNSDAPADVFVGRYPYERSSV
ncbi:hypothetical protein [Nocardia brasiliensis]